MAKVREMSETSYYHITVRGVGQMPIFEDDEDRLFYLRLLAKLRTEERVRIIAWTLMGNHVHLVVDMTRDEMPTRLMRRLDTTYAMYFQKKTEHVGHVFQRDFWSGPITTDEQLIATVDYVHRNPERARISSKEDYRWSSYREYCGKKGYADTSFVLDVFGGLSQFKTFHDAQHQDERCLEAREVPLRGLSDEDARCIADKLLEDVAVGSLKGADRQTRDKALAMLKARGLSVRQIQRMTGISLGVISKAGKEMNT